MKLCFYLATPIDHTYMYMYYVRAVCYNILFQLLIHRAHRGQVISIHSVCAMFNIHVNVCIELCMAYRKHGNIGVTLNLAIWQSAQKLPN